MKLPKTSLPLRMAAVSLVLIAGLGAYWWHKWYTNTDEYKARRLIAGLRRAPPGPLVQWLRDHNLAEAPLRRDEEEIAKELGDLGSAAVPALVTGLADKNWVVRCYSAKALRNIGLAAKDAEPRLISALEDSEWTVRVAAAEALGRIGRKDIGLAFLERGLQSKYVYQRYLSAEGLGNIGPSARDAVPALVRCLNDANGGVRFGASIALGKIGLASGNVVRSLGQALQDDSGDIRWAAAEALGLLGGQAKEAIPALRQALKDENEGVRKAAAKALKKIQTGDTASAEGQE